MGSSSHAAHTRHTRSSASAPKSRPATHKSSSRSGERPSPPAWSPQKHRWHTKVLSAKSESSRQESRTRTSSWPAPTRTSNGWKTTSLTGRASPQTSELSWHRHRKPSTSPRSPCTKKSPLLTRRSSKQRRSCWKSCGKPNPESILPSTASPPASTTNTRSTLTTTTRTVVPNRGMEDSVTTTTTTTTYSTMRKRRSSERESVCVCVWRVCGSARETGEREATQKVGREEEKDDRGKDKRAKGVGTGEEARSRVPSHIKPGRGQEERGVAHGQGDGADRNEVFGQEERPGQR